MVDLVKTNESGSAWCPVSILKLDNFLLKVISSGHGYQHSYALRKNLAYNLQHIEFLHKCLNDIKLTSVLRTQTWKTVLLVGCGVMESLLHYLLVKKNLHSTTEWELKVIMPGNQKTVDGIQTKVDSHICTKLSKSKPTQMNFESIIQKSKNGKILGTGSNIYSNLDNLRRLRNKVHLQAINNPTDTDWNSFNKREVDDMDEILYLTFTSNIFRPSQQEKEYFLYLHEYFTN